MKTTKLYATFIAAFICYILAGSAVHYYYKIRDIKAQISHEQRKFIQIENGMNRTELFTAIQHQSTVSAWTGISELRTIPPYKLGQ
jgi:cell division protein YceG involved in septum cleavage